VPVSSTRVAANEMPGERLHPVPDAALVGYYKGGTTLLRGYLDHHPDITWSRSLAFLVGPDLEEFPKNYRPEIDASCSVFVDCFEGLSQGLVIDDPERWRTDYLIPGVNCTEHPNKQDLQAIPSRLSAVFPDTKVIMVIREQVSIIRSIFLHFQMGLPAGQRTFRAFLDTLAAKIALRSLCYDEVIHAYRARLGEERVLVLLNEQMRDDLPSALAQLCSFLGVEYVDYPQSRQTPNTGRTLNFANLCTLAESLGWGVARRPTHIRRLASVLPFLGGDVIDREMKRAFRATFASSNAATAQMTGLPLAQYGYPL
jgi:hypothetical protein